MEKKPKLPSVEKSLEDIATLIDQMEHSNPTLEQSLNYFERGITLIKHAQKCLQEAEHKVQILLQHPTGENTLEPHENDDENA